MLDTLQQRIAQHQFLGELRTKLLHLHHLLLNTERIAYERVRGKVSNGELLHLAINHSQFAWLHPLSRLIVRIDDSLRSDEPCTPEQSSVLVTEVRTLLAPNEQGNDFAMRYDLAFQQSPDVVLAHADVVMFLPVS